MSHLKGKCICDLSSRVEYVKKLANPFCQYKRAFDEKQCEGMRWHLCLWKIKACHHGRHSWYSATSATHIFSFRDQPLSSKLPVFTPEKHGLPETMPPHWRGRDYRVICQQTCKIWLTTGCNPTAVIVQTGHQFGDVGILEVFMKG